MRILLAHNSTYYPATGGGDKSNRLLMEALAGRGHQVRVVTRVERFGPEDRDRLVAELRTRNVQPEIFDAGWLRMLLNGVDVRVLTVDPNLRVFFSRNIAEFDPDIIVTSTDDPAQLLFDLAVKAPRARVVYLVRATIAVPFGPESSSTSAVKTEMLRHAGCIVGVSQYVADYVRRWGGLQATHVPISLLDAALDPPFLGSFDNPYVSMVNPCAVKGIAIFLELAKRMPETRFAAIPGWGTTQDDLLNLRGCSNITLFDPVDNIDDFLRITKLMLVPSVWAEARSRIVPESMSRGVPVLASNIGGIPEAHLGIDYLLPVNPVTRYQASVDDNMVPIAEVPPQDVDPWQRALERLLVDRVHYGELAMASRQATLDYARSLSVRPFEELLERLLETPKKAPPGTAPLSDAKRRLLALRLKQKAAQLDPWFAGIEDHQLGRTLLFCFPYAGGGTILYRSWRHSLETAATVCALRLPGRESRLAESPIADLETLIEQIGSRITPHLQGPFVFFGHSMGAIIAFELARWLRRNSLPLPLGLIASGARAPQFRLNHTPGPEPDDSDLLEQVRRLEGMTPELLENERVASVVLPTLRADTRLYRNYVFRPEPPFEFPIVGYGGESDPNVRPDHVEAWREQTTGEFLCHIFPGGHFFLKTAADFLPRLQADLR